jgi:hypothetical protein
MSVDLSGEITAIATTALAAFAVVTAVFALLAYRKQAQEVGLLMKQSERDAAERRRAQAAQVFIGVSREPGSQAGPYAANASDFPIVEAQFWCWRGSGLSAPDDLGMIMPGEQIGASPGFSADYALASVLLTFRDALGVRWIRTPDGLLIEQGHGTTGDNILARFIAFPEPHSES